MPAREIPREEWSDFCRRFSQQHRGWIASIEVGGAGTGVRVEGRELPLAGLSLDRKGSEAPAVELMLGEAPGDHVTHVAAAPTSVRFLETPEGAHEGLEIETESGAMTTLRFRDPALPKPAYVL